MIKLVQELIDELNNNAIVYCHWKSNNRLSDVFSADEDIDLLVRKDNAVAFQRIMGQLGFKLATQHFLDAQKTIFHYYGLDAKTCKIVHVHVYYQIITGGTILKNYRLPVEQMLLSGNNTYQSLKIPETSSELTLLVIRKIVESGSLVELLFVRREMHAIQEELQWLLQNEKGSIDQVIDDVMNKLEVCFPSIDRSLFEMSLRALMANTSAFTLWRLGSHMRRKLKCYQIYGCAFSTVLTLIRFIWILFKHFILRKRVRGFNSGGIVVAVVGPEATGKSTIVERLAQWLAKDFAVMSVHTGKPPSTLLTVLPNLFMPLLRGKFPKFRTCNIEENIQNSDSAVLSQKRLIIYSLRSLMIGHDRQALLRRVFRKASRGSIVICDRYPTPYFGAMDSAQLDLTSPSIQKSRIFSFLGKVENKMYRVMPQPDLVIQLTTPVDIAVKRNIFRDKHEAEDEDYVRRRHLQSRLQKYPLSHLEKVDTNLPIETTMAGVKEIVWAQL